MSLFIVYFRTLNVGHSPRLYILRVEMTITFTKLVTNGSYETHVCCPTSCPILPFYPSRGSPSVAFLSYSYDFLVQSVTIWSLWKDTNQIGEST